jgi:(1->4)-alpha-D-glucan 1-alpha-D-glucosylmutase
VIGAVDQANLPGTTDGHPNWRRKLPLPLEDWPDDERFATLASAVDRMRRRAAPPAPVVVRATYRLQLHRDFRFADATALIPYLDALGVSHVYCSPYLRARPGSHHGYDIVDHSSLNPEIGTRDDFERLVRTLERYGMSHLCDVVPNHMGIMGADNGWWMDVLENGPASRYADYFDIDWEPLDRDMTGRILVPVLGAPYGVVLENGELRLTFEPDRGSFAVRYFEHRFPIDPRERATIIERALAACDASLPPRQAVSVATIVARLRGLPARTDPDPDRIAQRRRDAAELSARTAELAAANPPLAAAIARVCEQYSGADGIETLHALLEQQAYRLAYWRVASDEINYRRFFDIQDLAALRTENEEAFDATHAFVLELAARGEIEGFRIDHPDGLYDPEQYFERLRRRYGELVGVANAAPYVVIEKIRAPHERLPASWAIHGDTGYAFANAVNGVFVDTAAKSRVDRAWRAFVGDEAATFEEAAYRGKRIVMRSSLAAELAVLANRATRIARADRRTRDFTQNALREAIAETVAHFPVYRSYVTERGASEQDRRYVEWAIGRAKRRARSSDAAIFDFLARLMIGEPAPGLADLRALYVTFAMRVQQFTAPVAAKGIEDTAFYTFNRLMSLNDVGGDPDRFGMTVRAFHRAASERAQRWRGTLIATSTHDNKRSEDVRARIDVISEMPAAWRLAARRWSRMNRTHKRVVDDRPAPSRNDEYLLYQTLVGSLPAVDVDASALAAYRERIVAYMTKAAREAKVNTAWMTINEEYEKALASFVEAVLRPPGESPFFDDLIAALPPFAWFGLLNTLSMSLLKFTQPGVPDIYQGCEILDFSLVDPDNRRPVDFALRREQLMSLRALADCEHPELAHSVRGLFATPYDGRAKLWVALRALGLRREHPKLFSDGDYRSLDAAGARAKHLVAYARRHGRDGALVIAGRLYASLGLQPGVLPVGRAAWVDTTIDVGQIPRGTALRNVLTGETWDVEGERLQVADACANFPVALFTYTVRG